MERAEIESNEQAQERTTTRKTNGELRLNRRLSCIALDAGDVRCYVLILQFS